MSRETYCFSAMRLKVCCSFRAWASAARWAMRRRADCAHVMQGSGLLRGCATGSLNFATQHKCGSKRIVRALVGE
eukprot:5277941-Pyramimonas_sp.AAC.1